MKGCLEPLSTFLGRCWILCWIPPWTSTSLFQGNSLPVLLLCTLAEQSLAEFK